MIEKQSSDLHVILHDSPEPPRLLVIPKRRLQRFLVGIPLFIIFVVVVLVAAIWLKAPSLPIKVSIPNLPTKTDDAKVNELEGEIIALKKAQEAMQVKLAQTTVSESEVWLGPVKKPYALQDLSSKSPLRLDAVHLEDSAGKRVLRFNLINAGQESDRVTGHIFVFQIDSRGMAPYPAMTNQEWSEGIRYNKGESFAVSRLRPVEAPFPPADAEAKFLVLVFNREGDLLVRQELVGPFKAQGQ